MLLDSRPPAIASTQPSKNFLIICALLGFGCYKPALSLFACLALRCAATGGPQGVEVRSKIYNCCKNAVLQRCLVAYALLGLCSTKSRVVILFCPTLLCELHIMYPCASVALRQVLIASRYLAVFLSLLVLVVARSPSMNLNVML